MVTSFTNFRGFNEDGADRGNQGLCRAGVQQTFVVRLSAYPDSRSLWQGQAKAESKHEV